MRPYLIWLMAVWPLPMFSQSVNAINSPDLVKLSGDTRSFTLTIIDAFPFINVTINGIRGKLMFDTGCREATILNSNALPLTYRKLAGSGSTASGQQLSRSVSDTVAEIRVDSQLVYHNVRNIKCVNLDFLQARLTPDCLGFLGYDFFDGYLFKLDYLRNQVTFYKNTPQRQSSKDFLRGEDLLAVLTFETRLLPNHPFVYIQLGKTTVTGAFDTGQYGLVQLTPVVEKELIKSGRVRPAGITGRGDTIVHIAHVNLTGTFAVDLLGMEYIASTKSLPFKEKIGMTESNILTLGYRFLSQYKTVWDYDSKKIYVLKNK